MLADCKFAGLKEKHHKLRETIKKNKEDKNKVVELKNEFCNSYKRKSNDLKRAVQDGFDKYPLAFFLTGVDLLSDANRVHWDVLDYNKQHVFYRRQVKKAIEVNELANIPNYVFARNTTNWEIKLLLGAIVGINGITLETKRSTRGKQNRLYITFTNSLKNGTSATQRKYGYIFSDDDALFNLDDSIFELCDMKKMFLKVLLKKICGLTLYYYDYK